MSLAYSTLRLLARGPHHTGGLGSIQQPKKKGPKRSPFPAINRNGSVRSHECTFLRGAVLMVCSKCSKEQPLTP